MGSLIKLWRLAIKYKGSSCLCLPSGGMTSVCHYNLLLHMGFKVWTPFKGNFLQTEPSPLATPSPYPCLFHVLHTVSVCSLIKLMILVFIMLCVTAHKVGMSTLPNYSLETCIFFVVVQINYSQFSSEDGYCFSSTHLAVFNHIFRLCLLYSGRSHLIDR